MKLWWLVLERICLEQNGCKISARCELEANGAWRVKFAEQGVN